MLSNLQTKDFKHIGQWTSYIYVNVNDNNKGTDGKTWSKANKHRKWFSFLTQEY